MKCRIAFVCVLALTLMLSGCSNAGSVDNSADIFGFANVNKTIV